MSNLITKFQIFQNITKFVKIYRNVKNRSMHTRTFLNKHTIMKHFYLVHIYFKNNIITIKYLSYLSLRYTNDKRGYEKIFHVLQQNNNNLVSAV